jgi:hypothetical protein
MSTPACSPGLLHERHQHRRPLSDPVGHAAEGQCLLFPCARLCPFQTLQCISRGLLPGLIKLLQVPEYRDQVPALLATLLSCQPSLLPLLLETDTLKQLLGMLQANHNNNNNSSSSSSASPQLRASCLRALGSFALASGEARRQLVDSKAWPTAVAALSEEGSAQVRGVWPGRVDCLAADDEGGCLHVGGAGGCADGEFIVVCFWHPRGC